MFRIVIPPSREVTLPFANLTNTTIPICIYSDGSGFKGGIGTSALLYVNDHLSRSLYFYLGTPQEHMVYEAEGVSLVLGLHLLNSLIRQLNHSAVLGTDSQAVIRAVNNQSSHSGQYMLNAIHQVAEHLHTKQDDIINHSEHL